jgi:hypothetical protein
VLDQLAPNTQSVSLYDRFRRCTRRLRHSREPRTNETEGLAEALDVIFEKHRKGPGARLNHLRALKATDQIAREGIHGANKHHGDFRTFYVVEKDFSSFDESDVDAPWNSDEVLCHALTAEGLPTPSGGALWTASTVQRVKAKLAA